MSGKPFDKLDDALRKRLGRLRRKEVPPEMLRNFSASVEERIRERQSARSRGGARSPFRIPVWVPVLAVLVLSFFAVLRTGLGPPGLFSPGVRPDSLQELDLADQIAVLRELGVWTDDDEILVSGYEDVLKDLDLQDSDAGSASPLV